MAMKEYLTDAGVELLGQMLAGKAKITFTKVEMGDGTMPAGVPKQQMTGLVNVKATLDVYSVTVDAENIVEVTANFNNAELTEGFYYREKGVYATDGTNEVLFTYSNSGSSAEYINPSSVEVIEKKIISLYKGLQDTEAIINITIKSGIYASPDPATYVSLGLVKPDGETIFITNDGTISAKQQHATIIVKTNAGALIGQPIELYYGTTKITEKTMPAGAQVTFDEALCIGEYTVKAAGGGRRYELQVLVTEHKEYTVSLDNPVGANIFITGAISLAPRMLNSFTVPDGYYRTNSTDGFQVQVVDAVGGATIETLTISENTAFISIDTELYSRITLKASDESGLLTPDELTFDVEEKTSYDKTISWTEKYVTQVITTGESELLGVDCTMTCGDIVLKGPMAARTTFILKEIGDWTIVCGDADDSATVTALDNSTLAEIDLSLMVELTLLQTYTLGGYDWIVVSLGEGYAKLVRLQQTRCQNPTYLRYKNTSFSSVPVWIASQAADCSSVAGLSTLYNSIKNADYNGRGLCEMVYEDDYFPNKILMRQKLNRYWNSGTTTPLWIAARNGSTYTEIGITSKGTQNWDDISAAAMEITSGGGTSYPTYMNVKLSGYFHPAFYVNLSKVKLNGTALTVK